MALTKEEFEVFKTHQYCDNPSCGFHGQVGQENIKTHSVKGGQIYGSSSLLVVSAKFPRYLGGLNPPSHGSYSGRTAARHHRN